MICAGFGDVPVVDPDAEQKEEALQNRGRRNLN